MDGFQFDRLTKIIASRRTSRQGLPRLALAVGLAAAGPGRAAARADLPGGREQLSCGRHRHVLLRRPRLPADQPEPEWPLPRRHAGRRLHGPGNSCARRSEPDGVPCPQDAGGRCVVLDNGRPFCARETACFECRSNVDSNRRFKRTGGRCPRCDNCARSDRRACVFGRRS